MTGETGIFAGGDAAPSERTATVAIGHGKRAARGIDAYLAGHELIDPPRHELATFDRSTPGTTPTPRDTRPELERARRADTFDEVVEGLTEENALFEARRCLSCGNCFGCDNCFGVCPDNAVSSSERGVRVRLRLLQGLWPVRAGMPLRRDRHGSRADLTRRRVGVSGPAWSAIAGVRLSALAPSPGLRWCESTQGRAVPARVQAEGLEIAPELYRFLVEEALPGSGVEESQLWRGLSSLVGNFSGRNRELLARRVELQSPLDAWHRERRHGPFDVVAYRALLEEIGYLVPEPSGTTITTEGVDDEIAEITGPQLIVPVMNARYALNAANARWGSLYDALYGTDALGDPPPPGPYEPPRGRR